MEKHTMRKIKGSLSLLFILFLITSCQKKEVSTYYIIQGSSIEIVETNLIKELKADLQKVVGNSIKIISDKEKIPADAKVIVVGTPKSNAFIKQLASEKKIVLSEQLPGARGGIWANITLTNNIKAIILAGSDVQGTQYAVYDYAHEILGLDPLAYWTGKKPELLEEVNLFDFKNKTILPPKVPILCYFENDVDELANYRGKLLEYDWESYTEMINSLVRMRYNAIQLFDMLGRPEFFMRPEYKKLHPNYKIDIAYLDKMIDYAQSKGMKVAIDFALGYQIHPMSADKATCWSEYKEDWLKAWQYYLEETPLKKTDIFMLRSRHQVWDWEYQSSCGEDKIDVFTEVYKAFGTLVDTYKPKAEKVLVCYSDGMDMWNNGFRPPKDWIVCWADDGFGDFKFLPESTDGYEFGTYMHAGFWSNHTVHNPYPEKIETVMKTSFEDLKADKFCLVNGQNFRPFLLNIEAYSEVCNIPENFKGDTFYQEWTERYFDKEIATYAIKSMKLLSKAQDIDRIGYVQHLWEIREAIAYLSNSSIERPGKDPVPYTYLRVENDLKNVENSQKHIQAALLDAKKGYELLNENDTFFYSYIYLPVTLYSDLLNFEQRLHQMSKLKRLYETSGDLNALKEALLLVKNAQNDLKIIYSTRIEGDKSPKWDRWYDPEIRRPNNGFPTQAMLENIENNLISIVKQDNGSS